ncbi:C40 family peptidase [Ectothiorhodospira marina]|jgi:cell wall-associated NlpC family hydrolase|uniref:Cell wall-associated hydrolase, NlpC family n=1 Tax=Ectothiorhodospira marina TaxID=1396821 RepID=A0A1H7F4A4_9GAMM|nr:C40 family peptidase [Ectothiorhodospira marina]SEK20919.1 Cell wall-associated hydrolase, NlpC family [Ectothiorhodospira marina]
MARTLRGGALFALGMTLMACSTAPERPETALPPVNSDSLSEQRAGVVFAALNQVGTPYQYGGQSPREGFDCSGLVWYTHQHAGLSVPRTAREQSGRMKPVATRSLKPGDLLFFRTKGAGPSHVSIYIGDGHFVHAPSSGRSVSTERLDNPYWSRRFLHAGHYYEQD